MRLLNKEQKAIYPDMLRSAVDLLAAGIDKAASRNTNAIFKKKMIYFENEMKKMNDINCYMADR
jgi:hypothetical protein